MEMTEGTLSPSSSSLLACLLKESVHLPKLYTVVERMKVGKQGENSRYWGCQGIGHRLFGRMGQIILVRIE